MKNMFKIDSNGLNINVNLPLRLAATYKTAIKTANVQIIIIIIIIIITNSKQEWLLQLRATRTVD